MIRAQLEHIIRAAGAIADVDELVVIGSQAILGQFPGAPAELLVSNGADLYPRRYPELAATQMDAQRRTLVSASIQADFPGCAA